MFAFVTERRVSSEIFRRSSGPHLGDVPRRSLGDDAAPFVAGTRAHVDDPVAGGDDVEIMLDDNHRIAGVDQSVELHDQPLDVGRVQAGSRFVEHIKRIAALHPL